VDILIALVVGASAGALLHYLQTGRDTRGAALAPMLGAVVGGVVWLAMTWAGVTTLSPWIWVISFAAPFAVVPVAIAVLTRARARHDVAERARLGIG